ncbi:MAG: CvpA family protein [Chloroflexi bacterium]|nr:CvpA family protein [Chloroflexota bacterium]
MNWVDILIIIAAGIGALIGWKVGFLGAIFNVIGIFVGIWVAANFSQAIAGWIAGQGASDTLATVLSYVAIVVGIFIAAQIAKAMVKKALSLVFLGWVDTAGSILVGLVFGFLLAGGLVMGLSRMSVDLPEEGATSFLMEMTGARKSVQEGLVKSKLVGTFIEVADAVPANVFGLVPGDFKKALDLIDSQRRLVAGAGAPP